MNENQSGLNTNISGGTQGVAGTNTGTVNITTYISQTNSETEIHTRKLIEGSPYLGLEKFGVDDKDKFFGRDRWIIELTNYLAKENVLLLLGASGSGKSSLIQAGLMPQLKDQWGSQFLSFTFVPDVDPFESFYGCLLTKYKQSDAKTARIVQEDTLIKVVDSLKKEGIQWLIFVDQFEELFTRTPQKERDIFVKSLIHLIDKNDPTVKVVMTMRADFLDKLGPYPALGRVHDRHSRMLTDMEDSDLRLAIAEPAARNGVTFETGLTDKIIADFHQQAGSLPLLQYMLNLLWKKDNLQDRILNSETYQKLGGVTGALQQQADKIYAQFDDAQRKVAEQIFLELITLEGEKSVSRRVEKSVFEKDEVQKKVLDHLIDNRLLVSKHEDGKATVEVAHEELLRSWKMLRSLISAKKEILIWRGRLYADAQQWYELRKQDSQKAKDELWSGLKLSRILGLIKRQVLPNLNPIAIQFVRDSINHQNQLKAIEAERRQREVNTELSLANSLSGYSLYLCNEGKELDAFVEAIKAGKILQKHKASNTKVVDTLQKILKERKEYNRLVGHGNGIRSVSFSSDGKTLASGSLDKTIKVWNIETGQEIRTLSGHNDNVWCLNFSSDGKTLASGSSDNTIRLWNIETGKEIYTLTEHNDSVTSVSFSSDGKTLASGSSDNTIRLWNVETGQEIRSLSGYKMSFSSDGKTLASGGDDTIKLWDVETGKEIHTLSGHTNNVTSVSFSSDGKTLASGSWDNTIKLWNVETGQEILALPEHNIVWSVSFSPDGKLLASGGDDEIIKLWNVQIDKEICTLFGHNNSVNSVSFSPDGKTLASGSSDNTIKLWNVETGKEIRALSHNNSVNSVSFIRDGKTLASGGDDGIIKLWDVETGQEIRSFSEHTKGASPVSFSSDGKILAFSSYSYDRTIKLWNVETDQEIRSLSGHNSFVDSASFSPDGKTLASGSGDKTIKLWNVGTGQEIRSLSGHTNSVLSVSFSPDSKILASSCFNGIIKLWNVETGQEIRTLSRDKYPVNSVSFSPDGRTLASGSEDGTIKLWNGSNGWGLDALMERSCDWVWAYLHNPNSGVKEEDRHLCDGIGDF